MRRSTAGRLIGPILLLVGAALLIAALVTPWYSYAVSIHEESGGGPLNETTVYFLGISSMNGTIRHYCSGFGGFGACTGQTSYSTEDLNNTGIVAESALFVVIGASAIGVLAAALGMTSRGDSRRVAAGLALSVVSLALGIVAPVLFALTLPSAMAKDFPHHPASGPSTSFFGSSSNTTFFTTVTIAWGPALGSGFVPRAWALVALLAPPLPLRRPGGPRLGGRHAAL